jgi:phytoene synthase
MEIYDKAADVSSRAVIRTFSTSFGLASKLFTGSIRQDIYNIYGLVRLADEIVDTYRGVEAGIYLDALELDTYHSLETGFSSNLIVHAFAKTARHYGINKTLIAPFFISMRLDLPNCYKVKDYVRYIYGSAEVVGLMCLAVFCQGDEALYKNLEPGARSLGAAFQKVNFLRDLQADYTELGRYYFQQASFDTFDEKTKAMIIADIAMDFEKARPAIDRLPANARPAVLAAYRYYSLLLNKLQQTSASEIKKHRIRVATSKKLWVLAVT